ncbi:hypothetical protein BC833DRAFT_622692 [Globomyces pollinis-pini]|nr:hypothetical protein BC833DRAFT_622692 [Globomyces pollinis-pini]
MVASVKPMVASVELMVVSENILSDPSINSSNATIGLPDATINCPDAKESEAFNIFWYICAFGTFKNYTHMVDDANRQAYAAAVVQIVVVAYQLWRNKRAGYRIIMNFQAGEWHEFALKLSTHCKITPITLPNGETTYQPDEIFDTWKNHFKQLATPHIDAQRLAVYWKERCDMNSTHTPSDISLENMNRDIEITEVISALKKLKMNKAPGIDGIVPGLWKVCFLGVDDTHPDQLFFLHSLLNSIWKHSKIPTAWQTGVFVPIFKNNGDSLDCNDYRGQFGFRKKMETSAAIASLIDIASRRRAALDEETFATFIDLRKAFDTVSIGALIFKLKK